MFSPLQVSSGLLHCNRLICPLILCKIHLSPPSLSYEKWVLCFVDFSSCWILLICINWQYLTHSSVYCLSCNLGVKCRVLIIFLLGISAKIAQRNVAWMIGGNILYDCVCNANTYWWTLPRHLVIWGYKGDGVTPYPFFIC